MRLEHLLEASARRDPDAIAAFETSGVAISYAALESFAGAVAIKLGVASGDRVGLCVPKCIASLACVFGAMKAGASYVPVDYSAPTSRNAFIFNDCQVRAIVVERDRAAAMLSELSGAWREIALDEGGEHAKDFVILGRTDEVATPKSPDLSYILYTSGSTGRPKGVTHSHATALAFIDWCSQEFQPTPQDVFSSHAPFHFDLSILDIYVPIKHGASVVLIGAEAGKQPGVLADVIANRGISVWYSTPSILRVLVEYGELEKRDCSRLRIVNFAGEVFPIKHLQALVQRWSWPDYYNLYGPTETNVCTFLKLRADFVSDRETPLPIGRKCSDDETKVVDADGKEVVRGAEGELIVAGGSVMLGYWNLPERSAEAFFEEGGEHWYRTGDIVREDDNGDYIFVGRRDRMVKRRGYRVELGEIEAALHRHPTVPEAAAIARAGAEGEVEIVAFLAWSDAAPFSTLKMKQFCAQHLPLYMVPDRFVALQTLPKTSTDKIDYQRLKENV